jgi:hypothetical protein
MEHLKVRLKIFLLIFCALLLLGTFGFMIIEKRSIIDSFYYVIVTIATVGYGDGHPVTDIDKIFSVVLIVMGVGTFLGVISNITEIMLARREVKIRMEKLNMVIGVFFSEAGLELLKTFSGYDPGFNQIRPDLLVKADWKDGDYQKARETSMHHPYGVEMDRVDLPGLKNFLIGKRDFFLRLLENPVLMEHQTFTDLLRAVFHLMEELAYRQSFSNLPPADTAHLGGDIKRAYHLMVGEWVAYMHHLKNHYPFLFSLSLRTNPFDPDVSVLITG